MPSVHPFSTGQPWDKPEDDKGERDQLAAAMRLATRRSAACTMAARSSAGEVEVGADAEALLARQQAQVVGAVDGIERTQQALASARAQQRRRH